MKSMHAPIQKAVFPVAGLGTRFLPATKASPKEMLPIVNKPLIQYAVEEAYAAGIRQMIFVTCHFKRAIEDHFDISHELEAELITHDKKALLSLVHAVKPEDMECFYVRQSKPLGLGHAVLCAESLIGDEAFAVLLADDLMIGKPPIMEQMVSIYAEHKTSVIAVQEVALEHTNQYGIITGTTCSNGLIDVSKLIEKPSPESAPSTTAVVGRYILNASIFDYLRALPQGTCNEIQLTDAINELLNKESVLAYRYQGTRYDCGSILGFLKANVDLGRVDPIEGERFSKWLLDVLEKQSLERR